MGVLIEYGSDVKLLWEILCWVLCVGPEVSPILLNKGARWCVLGVEVVIL